MTVMLLFRVWQAHPSSSTQTIFTQSLKHLFCIFPLNTKCVVALVVHEHLFDARGNLQNEDVNKTRRRRTESRLVTTQKYCVFVCVRGSKSASERERKRQN